MATAEERVQAIVDAICAEMEPTIAGYCRRLVVTLQLGHQMINMVASIDEQKGRKQAYELAKFLRFLATQFEAISVVGTDASPEKKDEAFLALSQMNEREKMQ